MNIHEQLWNAFNDIYFEEGPHRYTDSKGTIYQSATGWIGKFSPKVDWAEKAKGSALKKIKKEKGAAYTPSEAEITLVAQQLKDEWEEKGRVNGNYARTLGTQIHSVMENLWYKKDYEFDERLSEEFPEMREDFEFRKNRCKEIFRRMKRIYAPVENEFIVYDQPNALCGTIDFIAYNMKTKQYEIIDWKTSKVFEKGNFYEEYLLPPFDDILACNTAEYSLQLSLYKYMLEKKTDIHIDKLTLFQIPGKTCALPAVHECYDLSDRLKTLLG